ncbi:restriction endonuclease subunit S [Fusobacterium vincentii]
MYIYIYFNSKLINLENIGNKAFGKSLNKEFLEKEIPIPVPPVEVQKEIIEEVERLEEKYQNSRMKIEEYRKEIKKIFRNLDVIEEISEINGGGY